MSVASTRRSHISFQQEYDATITVPEDVILPRHSGASSSSQQTAANRVTTLSKLGALGTSSWNQLADYESVDSRNGIRETCANMDRETVVSSLFGSVSKEKRDRDQNVVRTLTDRQNLHKILELKVQLAGRGEQLAQHRLYEVEADVEVKNWEKRNSDISLYVINQEFESQRFQQQQANQWADQAQREKISLYGQMEGIEK